MRVASSWARGSTMALTASIAIVTACQDDVPPYGEVIIAVDTDLPVPQLAARLRIDVFADDGTWLSTRDIGLPRPADWPASFSVFTRDEEAPREVLVRLRAYADGKIRDYRGERFFDRPSYSEPFVAHDLEGLCAAPPLLVFGEELTLRRGLDLVTDNVTTTDCQAVTESGAVAARVEVTEPGAYRFAVTRSTTGQSTLFLRTDCATETSQIACDANILTSEPEPDFTVDLEPGVYTLIQTSGLPFATADVVLRGARAEDWDTWPAPPPPSPDPPQTPRLIVDGVDVTPATEPQPRVTVDRLLRITLTPGRVQSTRVTLRGECLGTMSRLAATEVVERLVAAEAETCVDVENERGPVALAALSPDLEAAAGGSVVGEFEPGDACPADTGGMEVCIPGGVFFLGSPYGTLYDVATLPERVAVMPRFWIDRDEVTVGRFRAALAAGFVPPSMPIETNPTAPFCPWTPSPSTTENFALACVNWFEARAFCQWAGGDLPTEAEWEYAASAAGRSAEARYPWGDEAPTCDIAVFAKSPDVAGQCFLEGYGEGPLPIDARATTDVTPLGVVNLGGNLTEYTLDSAYGYDHPCWDAAPLRAPSCLEDSGPRRVLRGGSWFYAAQLTQTTQRIASPGRSENEGFGFRCAYADEAIATSGGSTP